MEETETCANHSPLILLKQGAEARVFESNFVGRRSVIKERFSKKYRHPTLDTKLTLRRLNAEARCMTKARKLGVCTPALYAVDTVLNTLTFEYVEGPSLKEVLLEFGLKGVVEERLDDIASQVGDAIGKLHDGGLIHGDLTTSNMLLKSGTNQLVLIDFGLSFTSTLPEDKAVDLYVLERALLSMHSSCGNVEECASNVHRHYEPVPYLRSYWSWKILDRVQRQEEEDIEYYAIKSVDKSQRSKVLHEANQETLQKVCDIVKKQLALPEGSSVTGESKFATLGADSLDSLFT